MKPSVDVAQHARQVAAAPVVAVTRRATEELAQLGVGSRARDGDALQRALLHTHCVGPRLAVARDRVRPLPPAADLAHLGGLDRSRGGCPATDKGAAALAQLPSDSLRTRLAWRAQLIWFESKQSEGRRPSDQDKHQQYTYRAARAAPPSLEALRGGCFHCRCQTYTARKANCQTSTGRLKPTDDLGANSTMLYMAALRVRTKLKRTRSPRVQRLANRLRQTGKKYMPQRAPEAMAAPSLA